MNLHNAAQICSALAVEKGFVQPSWDNFATKVMLVVTEIDEAAAWLREDVYSPVKFREELADVVIRTLDILETLWPDWPTGRISTRHTRPQTTLERPEVLLWPLIGRCCRAIEVWRLDNQLDAQQHLEFLLLTTYRLADRLGIDLDEEILKKIALNRTRPHLHGKARSDG